MALLQQSASLEVASGGPSGNVVFPGNTTAGSLIVIICFNHNNNGAVFACSGFATDISYTAGISQAIVVLGQQNTAGGATTFGVTYSGSTEWSCIGYEFSDVLTTGTYVDASASNSNDSTSNPNAAPSGQIDTTGAGPIIVAYNLDRTLSTITGPSGWAGSGTRVTAATGGWNQGYANYKIATGASTDERGAVTFSAGANYNAVIVAYKATAGGSSSVPPPFPRFNYAILNH